MEGFSKKLQTDQNYRKKIYEFGGGEDVFGNRQKWESMITSTPYTVFPKKEIIKPIENGLY